MSLDFVDNLNQPNDRSCEPNRSELPTNLAQGLWDEIKSKATIQDNRLGNSASRASLPEVLDFGTGDIYGKGKSIADEFKILDHGFGKDPVFGSKELRDAESFLGSKGLGRPEIGPMPGSPLEIDPVKTQRFFDNLPKELENPSLTSPLGGPFELDPESKQRIIETGTQVGERADQYKDDVLGTWRSWGKDERENARQYAHDMLDRTGQLVDEVIDDPLHAGQHIADYGVDAVTRTAQFGYEAVRRDLQAVAEVIDETRDLTKDMWKQVGINAPSLDPTLISDSMML